MLQEKYFHLTKVSIITKYLHCPKVIHSRLESDSFVCNKKKKKGGG
jgi:hypothetical protein